MITYQHEAWGKMIVLKAQAFLPAKWVALRSLYHRACSKSSIKGNNMETR